MLISHQEKTPKDVDGLQSEAKIRWYSGQVQGSFGHKGRYTQEYDIDNSETFSQAVKMTTIQCILVVTSSKQWPEGLPNPSTKVCKLKKSIYGLKQTSIYWFTRLTTEPIRQGFRQSKNDCSLFSRHQDNYLGIVAVYVDDIIIIVANVTQILSLTDHLHNVISIKDLDFLNFFS